MSTSFLSARLISAVFMEILVTGNYVLLSASLTGPLVPDLFEIN
jgi:hypothetical protein